MDNSLAETMTAPQDSKSGLNPCPFGQSMRLQHFGFAPTYLPLNHGSYGVSPHYVQEKLHALHKVSNERPTVFMKWTMPKMQAESRAAVAQILCCPVDDLVLVPNNSTASDLILRNVNWKEGDVILYHDLTYPALKKALCHIEEISPVRAEKVNMSWPVSDDDLERHYEEAILRINAETSRQVRMLIIDTITSVPGLLLPWERMCALARRHSVYSLVDGAHGIGHIDIDLTAAQPDFFFSALHKWLFVPRGCTAMYVNPRVCHLIRATLPISHSFQPLPNCTIMSLDEVPTPNTTSSLAELFSFVATQDYCPQLVIPAALAFRKQVCGGEKAIQKYCAEVAWKGAEAAAEVLGTEVMHIPDATVREKACFLVNVRMPISLSKYQRADLKEIFDYIQRAAAVDFDTFFQIAYVSDTFWWRISGQVYIEVKDIVKGAEYLKILCARVRDGSWIEDRKRKSLGFSIEVE
ncbi:uncharacterized protein [Bemisia tabaci]